MSGQHGQGVPRRGPFGTQEGDRWTCPGSPVQDLLDAKGEGLVMVTEIIGGEEQLYVTDDEELIAEAQAGYELLAAVRAAQN